MTQPTQPTTRPTSTSYTPPGVDSIARSAYAAFNARDWATLPSVFAQEIEMTVVPTGETLRGVAGVEQYMRGWIAAFGDARVEIDTLVQSGDVVVCEFRGVGTHTGPFRTPAGDIPATGRRVTISFCDVMRIGDGRIVSTRTYFDAASFARQLGV